jgi:hypothetical protein
MRFGPNVSGRSDGGVPVRQASIAIEIIFRYSRQREQTVTALSHNLMQHETLPVYLH